MASRPHGPPELGVRGLDGIRRVEAGEGRHRASEDLPTAKAGWCEEKGRELFGVPQTQSN